MRTREFAIVCVVALFVVGFAPAAAEKGDKQISFGILSSMPTDDLVDVLVTGTQTTELDSAIGAFADFEFHVTDLIGIEPGVSSVDYDLTVIEPGFPIVNGDTSLMTVTVNVNFHFKRDNGLDLFVGPTVGYGFWDDIQVDGFPAPFSTDEEFLYGINAGLGYPFGEGGWGFTAELGYLSVDVAPPGGDIGVSPIQAKVGLSYSF